MRSSFLVAFAMVSTLGANAASAASTLSLSDISSDQTPPALLPAALEFSVGGNSLKLRVSNLTSQLAPFNIRAIFFNAPQNVTGLVPLGENTGWSTLPNAPAAGFGAFRFGIFADQSPEPVFIAPGNSLDLAFFISGAGPFHDDDFTTHWSTTTGFARPALAAAWFIDGPDGDSAIGAVIPEPAACLFLAIGGTICLRRKSTRSRGPRSHLHPLK